MAKSKPVLQPVQVMVPPAVLEKLKAGAEKEGFSLSLYVRRMLVLHMIECEETLQWDDVKKGAKK